MELRDTEVCAFIEDMEYKASVQIHDVHDFAVIEAHVSCFKAGVEAKRRGLHPLAWIAASSDLQQNFSSLSRSLSWADGLDHGELLLERLMKEQSMQPVKPCPSESCDVAKLQWRKQVLELRASQHDAP